MNEFTEARRGWVGELNRSLRRHGEAMASVLDLFSGAGGFSLGFWASGFDVVGVDVNPDAVKTYTANLKHATCADLTNLADIPNADIIIAGPPCQPWSRAGKKLGQDDKRDGLSTTLAAVRSVRPLAIVVENVPELARGKARVLLDSFMSELRSLGYGVSEYILNAADFGVPQNRRRLFVTALLGGDPIEPPKQFATPVNVRRAIPGRWSREVKGSAILSESMNAYIERYERASGCKVPRDIHMDRPARTLTVRNLVGATGDMLRIRLPDGRRRTLSVREAARLQSFPDWFTFHGSDKSKFEQIGNAVPPLLALAVAQTVRDRLSDRNRIELAKASYPQPSSTNASTTMRANSRRDTKPERTLRSALHGLGLRFRVDYPIETPERRVRPDIVFTRQRVAVFVDGCFWHSCPIHGRAPKANANYWLPKLERNTERDKLDTKVLQVAGWKVLRIWEHEPVHLAVSAVREVLHASTTEQVER